MGYALTPKLDTSHLQSMDPEGNLQVRSAPMGTSSKELLHTNLGLIQEKQTEHGHKHNIRQVHPIHVICDSRLSQPTTLSEDLRIILLTQPFLGR